MSLLHPSPKQVDRSLQIADLRAAVDWLEAHPDVVLDHLAVAVGDSSDESAAAFCCDDDVTISSWGVARRQFGRIGLVHVVRTEQIVAPEWPIPTPAEIRERVAK